uniref:Uncharacterized protein n=1 Tax=Arundo donax TaxID=35708 RepID=A0A0A9A520_ARUDO
MLYDLIKNSDMARLHYFQWDLYPDSLYLCQIDCKLSVFSILHLHLVSYSYL